MYPSAEDPVYGTFIKVFYDYIQTVNGENNTHLITIKGRNGFKILKYVVFYLRILCTLICRDYDLIYVHTITFPIPPIWIVNHIKNLSLVFNLHGADLIGDSKLVHILRKLGHDLIMQSKLVVSPSSYFASEFKIRYPAYPRDKIIVSPSGGVDTAVFKPKRNICLDSDFVVGFVSRIDEGKGWDIYIRAMHLLHQHNYKVKGIIAGRGAQLEEMYALLRELNMESIVHYIGPIPHEKLPDVYSQFNLFCNASYRAAESLGLVTIEAMACGIPVVGSNMAGTAECIISGYNGFLFAPGSVYDLYAKIEDYLKLSNDTKKQLAENAVMFARKFETNIIMSKLYQQLLSIET